jgi:hypothetical protein
MGSYLKRTYAASEGMAIKVIVENLLVCSNDPMREDMF